MIYLLLKILTTFINESVGLHIYKSIIVRATNGGIHWDAVHGNHTPCLQDSKGAQPEIYSPAVHQRLPSGS